MHAIRILVYTDEYPPFRGGAGMYTWEVAQALHRAGAHIEVLAPSYANLGASSSLTDGDVITHRLDKHAGRFPKVCSIVARHFVRGRFDVLLLTERQALENMARMGRACPRPYAVTVHGSEVWDYFDVTRGACTDEARALLRCFFMRATAVIAGSHATSGLFASLLPTIRKTLHVVQYGISPGRFPTTDDGQVRALRKGLGIGDDLVVLSVGRLGIDKGQDMVVRAFEVVLRAIPNATLVIVGTGPLLDDCRRLAQESNVAHRTRFVGEVADVDLPVYYQLCDVFVLASRCTARWEGFGLVFLEASAFAKPVVGGAVGGVPEAVAHEESGLLVDSTCADDIAAALIRLLTDPRLRLSLGAAGRNRFHSHFTSDRMARDTLRVLEQIQPKQSSLPFLTRAVQSSRLLQWRFAVGGRQVLAKCTRKTRRVISTLTGTPMP